MNKAIILMSGGLDSLVSLGIAKQKYDVKLALTFNYGQLSFENEKKASKNICKYYKIKNEVLNLPWLKKITKSPLVFNNSEPKKDLKKEGSSLWIPNRNALFLNIAASYCDSYGYKYILFGANKEEAETFSDNTTEFCTEINKMFTKSTQVRPKVIAPLINYSKNDIVKIAIREKMPLELLSSCYNSGEKHCGKCESCKRLFRALKENNCNKYIDILFKNEN